MQTATHLKISDKWCCIKWKLSNFSSSTPVRRLLCSKPRENSYKPHVLRNYSYWSHFCRW